MSDLEKFMAESGGKNAQVIIPPECASFDAELTPGWRMAYRRRQRCYRGNKDHFFSDGTSAAANCTGDRCPQTVRTVPTYVWDPKKALCGLEEPMKIDDDPPDALRYVIKTKIALATSGMSSSPQIGVVYEEHTVPPNSAIVDVKYCEGCGLPFVRKNRDRVCRRCHSNPFFPVVPKSTLEILRDLAEETPLPQ